MKTRLACFVFILLSFTSMGQNCKQSFTEAQALYANGLFAEAISKLQPCYQHYGSVELKLRALEILAKSATMLNKEELALDYIQSLYELEPFYADAVGLNKKYDSYLASFKLRNTWRFELSVGFHQPEIRVTQFYSYGGQNTENEDYAAIARFMGTASAAYHLAYNLYLTAGLSFYQTQFSRSEVILNYQKASSTERYAWLAAPLSLEYQIGNSQWQPFVNAGWAPSFLASAQGDLALTPLTPDRPTGFIGVPANAEVDLRFQRQSMQHNLFLGAGLSYQWSHFSVGVQAQYWLGQGNMINVQERYRREDLIRTYAYLPDDIWLRALNLQIGLSYSLLKPVKMKK